MKSTTITNILLFLSLVAFVFARPLQTREVLDVYTPRVLYPTKGTVWKVGDNQIVTWSVSLHLSDDRVLKVQGVLNIGM